MNSLEKILEEIGGLKGKEDYPIDTICGWLEREIIECKDYHWHSIERTLFTSPNEKSPVRAWEEKNSWRVNVGRYNALPVIVVRDTKIEALFVAWEKVKKS